MGTRIIRRKLYDILSCVGIVSVAVGLVIFPSQMVDSAKSGVELCFNVIIPSLFPFFVLSSMTVRTGIADKLGKLLAPLMRPLFNVGGPCASALVLGIIGGYPVGAKTVISLYENGSCTKSEAERMLSFCNNSGPAFILGVVGAGIFSSSKVGLVLYLAHVASSVCVGLIFRGWGNREITCRDDFLSDTHESFSFAFTESVKGAFSSSLGICGFVIFFTVLIKLLFLSGILTYTAGALGTAFGVFGLDSEWAERLLTGMIELTSGVWSLRAAEGQLTASMAMAAFMLGWAGLSVHCQVLSFIGSSGISVKTYIIGKLLHGIFSAVFVLLLNRIITFDTTVAVYLVRQVSDMASLDFVSAVRISLVSAAVLWVIFAVLSSFSSKKGRKKRRNHL